MASLFTLFGDIFVENASANKAISDTVGNAETASTKTSASFGSVAKNVGVGVLAVGSAATAVTGALVSVASSTASAADAIDEGSQKLGMTTEGYQEWSYILDQNGMDIDSFGTSMKGMVTTMTDGSLESSGALDTLGLSLTDLQGMSQEDALEAVVAKFQELPEGADKSALAIDVFGKSGMDMLPVLDQTAGSLDDMKQTAHDYGMVMSDEAVTAGAELGDSLDALKMAGSGMMNSLGSAIVPLVQSVVDIITANLPMIQDIISEMAPIFADAIAAILPVFLQIVEQLLPPMLDLIQQLLPFLMDFASAILPIVVDLISALLPVILQIAEKVLPILLELIEPLLPLLDLLLPLLSPILELALALLTPMLDYIETILPPLIAIITNIVEVVVPPLVEIIGFVASGVQGLADFLGGKMKSGFDDFSAQCSAVGKVLSDVFGAAITGVKDQIDKLQTIFNDVTTFIKDVFSGNWKAVWDDVVTIFTDIFSTIGEIAKKPLNAIIDGLNTFIKAVNKIEIPDWVPEVGGMGINIPTIPKLKIGMDYVPSDDFPALLHRGESVLTADEASDYRTGRSGSGNTYAPTVNITISGAEQKTAKELLELISQAVSDQTFGMGGALNYGTL